MSTRYTFDRTLHPYGEDPDLGEVRIDTAARYGYWEWKSGAEGGGLWFERDTPGLVLSDFDGWYTLPARVVAALRAAGVEVDPVFD